MKIVELICNSMVIFFPKKKKKKTCFTTLFQQTCVFLEAFFAASFMAIRLFWFWKMIALVQNFSPWNRSSGKRNSDANLVFGFEESEDGPGRNRVENGPGRLKMGPGD